MELKEFAYKKEKTECISYNPNGMCRFQRRIHFESKGKEKLVCPCRYKEKKNVKL